MCFLNLGNNGFKSAYDRGLHAVQNRIQIIKNFVHDGILPLLDRIRQRKDVPNKRGDAGEIGYSQSRLDNNALRPKRLRNVVGIAQTSTLTKKYGKMANQRDTKRKERRTQRTKESQIKNNKIAAMSMKKSIPKTP